MGRRSEVRRNAKERPTIVAAKNIVVATLRNSRSTPGKDGYTTHKKAKYLV